MAEKTERSQTARFVFPFEEGSKDRVDLLGGKGAHLSEMMRAGLPVPPGFTITTEACKRYLQSGGQLDPDLEEQIFAALAELEKKTEKGFGDAGNPLLVSVRSGAPVSMPGMMDTILNLGLNDETVRGLEQLTGDARFARDCYRRFMQMFADVAMGVPHEEFESALTERKRRAGVRFDHELNAEQLSGLLEDYKQITSKHTGRSFPQDPREQLLIAVRAVFESWNNQRAKVYRRSQGISDDLGTAVNVQAMVFGNMGPTSGTGVLFTRNPNTGAPELYGEYLANAQGEDVVAGIRTPRSIQELAADQPEVYQQLEAVAKRLESEFRDMQDIEFTVERGRLFLLQTRSGKRTPSAAVKIGHDLAQEGIISRREALLRIDPLHIDKLLYKSVDPQAAVHAVAQGLAASPGAASGEVVFDAETAVTLAGQGRRVLLVRPETTPDDIHGIIAAAGVLTSRGGMTSHAAIVARGMGKPCVAGCEAITIHAEEAYLRVGEHIVRQGDPLVIDGSTGNVFLGEVPLIDPELSPEFETMLAWADEARRLGVWANADTPEDARRARSFGAEGIGLCRTEHMFMGSDRLPVVQAMILADDETSRRQALERLLPMQREDFRGILQAMDGLPVTVRLLDPPLHEFLPNRDEAYAEVLRLRRQAEEEETPDVLSELRKAETILERVRALAEANPMLGHRGCRLGMTFPEVYEMQVRALFEAAAGLVAEGYDPRPEVMIPLVSHVNELKTMRSLVERVARETLAEFQVDIPIRVGTMIEVPRACLEAETIATEADFFSFGTNDLTQTTFGFSRDDAEAKFLHEYLREGVLPSNPFVSIDRDGVGRLVEIGLQKGRAGRPDLKLGICGEHGGDPASIDFFEQAGLDYVSCSPYRVPLARLSAAQAALRRAGGTS